MAKRDVTRLVAGAALGAALTLSSAARAGDTPAPSDTPPPSDAPAPPAVPDTPTPPASPDTPMAVAVPDRATPSSNGRTPASTPEAESDEPPEDTCDLSQPIGTPLIGCRTPRKGVVSGFYLGVDAGYVWPKSSTEARVGVGPGFTMRGRIGIGFWDHVIADIGVGFLQLNDRRPTSEQVVDCMTVNGVVTSCDSSPHSADSHVTTGYLTAELGVQQRFRPWATSSFAPGLAVGYQAALGALSRGVSCDGCSSTKLDATVSGTYLAPYLRTTFGRLGSVAVIVRWSFYLGGDLGSIGWLGAEYGLP